MAAFNYIISQSVQSPSGSDGTALSFTGDVNNEAKIAISPTASNQANFFNVIQADIVAVELLFTPTNSTNGSIGGSLTVKTNSSGSPQDTIVLASGVPKIYATNGTITVGTIPFAGNVTEFFSTDNSTGNVGGTLTVKVLTNQ